jgi:hypothetical protein
MEKKKYVDKIFLDEELVKSFKEDKLTEDAKETLFDMARRYSNRLQYKSAEQHEYCKENAILEISKYWKGFNPDHPAKRPGMAFDYFTQIIKNGLARGWKKFEKTQAESAKL